jgi:hypothetical protein
MVVGDFYVPRTIISPAKADSPLIIDPDTVLASPIATEFLQAVPRRNAQVVQILRRCRAFAARLPRSARTSPQTCGTNFAIAGNSLRVTSRKAITTPVRLAFSGASSPGCGQAAAWRTPTLNRLSAGFPISLCFSTRYFVNGQRPSGSFPDRNASSTALGV